MNQTRSAQIYITPKLKRRLRWLRELENVPTENRIATIDEIAERLLNEKIESDFPNLPQLEKRLAALEEQMISELAKNKETQ